MSARGRSAKHAFAQLLGRLDQPPAEHVELVLVVGQMFGRDLDPHLVQQSASASSPIS